MGYSKLFSGSNSIFENILDEIQDPAFDGGVTQAETLDLVQMLLDIDTARLNNSNLGLGTMVVGQVQFDAVRNDAFLKSVGRSYIKRLSIIFSMKPAQDYYRAAAPSTSGNIYPQAYDYESDG
jgi:hypothetical protein